MTSRLEAATEWRIVCERACNTARQWAAHAEKRAAEHPYSSGYADIAKAARRRATWALARALEAGHEERVERANEWEKNNG